MLYDPALPWAPWAPQAGWNGSVYVLQGAGCGTGYTEQAAPSPLNDNALSKGFAVVQLSLVNNNSCYPLRRFRSGDWSFALLRW